MKRQKGFTLIELLLYMSLFVGFLVVLTEIFLATLDVQLESEATSAVAQDGRFILARMQYDLLRAELIEQPASLGQVASVLLITRDGSSYTYTQSDTNILLVGPLGTHRLNGFDSLVTGFTAQRLGDSDGKPTVRISYTVTSQTVRPKGPETRVFETTIGLR